VNAGLHAVIRLLQAGPPSNEEVFPMIVATLLLLAQSTDSVTTSVKPLDAPRAGAPSESTCDEPVLMVVSGPTHDRARMIAYGKAIADSGLYRQLGGYYINLAFPQEIFEGIAPAGYVNLIVRFPCMANARAFWNSRVYQEQIKPLRLSPSAGDYIVAVYPEAPLREDLIGKVGDNGYRADFDATGIAQVAP
jgi:uncharacterized protein (DUF1330 family)